MQQSKARWWFFLMCIFALAEFLLLGDYHAYFDLYFSPIVFGLASLLIAWTGLYASAYLPETFGAKHFSGLVFLIPATVLIILLGKHGYHIFYSHPIDYRESDVFAQVLTPSQLLQEGKFPYADVELPGYTMHNTYLPMQWLPFVLPVGLGFDPRWVPLVAWITAFMVTTWLILDKNKPKHPASWAGGILVLVLSIYVVYGFMNNFKDEYRRTLELLPAAYYIMLILFLLRGSWLGVGITLGCCLLSRFSVVLFLPFVAWYVWQRWGRVVFIKSAATAAVMILALFVLPFLLRQPSILSNILENYNSGAANEWSTQGWQDPGAEPYQLSRGFGAAIFVKKLYEYDKMDGIRHLRQAGIFFSLLVSFFMIYLYQRNKAFLNKDWILLGGIKLYFTVFYNLSLIPYSYLFLVPVSVTIVMLLKGYADVFCREDESKLTAQNL